MTSQLKDDVTKLEDNKTRLLKRNNDLVLKMKERKFELNKQIVGLKEELVEEKVD